MFIGERFRIVGEKLERRHRIFHVVTATDGDTLEELIQIWRTRRDPRECLAIY